MLMIEGACVYDPRNGIHGQAKSIFVQNGRIVSGEQGTVDTVIPAAGLIAMPGGIDIHTHIAGPKVNTGRILCPEDHRRDPVRRTHSTRSGVGATVPSTFVTGYRYAKLGYTTVVEAAMPPLKARHVHEELADTPIVDKGALVLMGNNHFILNLIRQREKERLLDYITWLLEATGGYGIKVVNPGGVANWKRGSNVRHLDDEVYGYGVTPRQIIDTLLDINEELRLPHAVHLHCNGLGQAGSDEVALATMALAAGRRLHITHLQFSGYRKANGLPFASGAKALAAVVNSHPNLTVDVGQVIFGPAVTMTADGPLQYQLHQLTGERWVNNDIEGETGSGVVPLVYHEQSYAGAMQWLIGLELFLLIDNPWQVYLTTDHPNAGPFTAYPWIIRLLMDQSYREEVAAKLNKRAQQRTNVSDLSREYTLAEIAITTRAGPARALGLRHKGHLGIGAQADIAIYRPQANYQEMFAYPEYVIKEGQVVVNKGEVIRSCVGKTLLPELCQRQAVDSWLAPLFEQVYSVSWANYPVEKQRYFPWEVISCT